MNEYIVSVFCSDESKSFSELNHFTVPVSIIKILLVFQHIICNYLNGVYLEDVYLKQATTDYRTKTTSTVYHTFYKNARVFRYFYKKMFSQRLHQVKTDLS